MSGTCSVSFKRRRARAPRGPAAVEALASLIPSAARDRTVGETARVQLDPGPRRGQRGAEGVVVGRCVGGGVDDVDEHGQDNRPGGETMPGDASRPPLKRLTGRVRT